MMQFLTDYRGLICFGIGIVCGFQIGVVVLQYQKKKVVMNRTLVNVEIDDETKEITIAVNANGGEVIYVAARIIVNQIQQSVQAGLSTRALTDEQLKKLLHGMNTYVLGHFFTHYDNLRLAMEKAVYENATRNSFGCADSRKNASTDEHGKSVEARPDAPSDYH